MSSLLQFVTAAAIVLGSDSRVGDGTQVTGDDTAKIWQLSDRVAVSSCILAEIRRSADDQLVYSADAFAGALPAYGDVETAVRDVEAKALATLSAVPTEAFDDLGLKDQVAEFTVAGYDPSGYAEVYKFYIRRTATGVAPTTPVLVAGTAFFPVSGACYMAAAGDTLLGKGAYYQDAMQQPAAPILTRLRAGADLSIPDSVALVCLALYEETRESTQVGGALRYVVLTPPGQPPAEGGTCPGRPG